ncbi:hypothetical protein BO71DRAFT_434249 [Aspergillus ellipticus CBS 707.79]|uniref:Uncharacterized protein n=1 Tax=Aspergillus ellipticus CBS 707.79 TaxID=1448320 RepID=A0A319CY89_9EURO|nr:hypothetical protein BO71DRAFT_434249 [Aspergillus ellipticus CBS 707.79]
MGSTFGHRNNNDTNNTTTSKNTTNNFRAKRRARHIFLSRNIYAATNQHGSRTYQRASHKHFYYHTHTSLQEGPYRQPIYGAQLTADE